MSSKEVKMNTATTISCKITEINKKMTIAWSGFSSGDNFVQSSGSYNAKAKSQTGTLAVKSPAVTEDKTYTCKVSSEANPSSAEKSSDVKLNVFCKQRIALINVIFASKL